MRMLEHINEIVAMQQNYAKTFAVVEKVKVRDLIEDALRMNEGALARHVVEVARDYEPPDCEINVEKHKVLQILINLIGNAKYALRRVRPRRKNGSPYAFEKTRPGSN